MKYAIRTLLKTPSFTAIAIVTIAIGIAANSAIFSVVNAVLLRPLPFPDEARVVRVFRTSREGRGNHSAGTFVDLKRNNRSFQAMAGFRGDVAAVTLSNGQPEQFQLQYVTADFFDVLGTPPALGRTFGGSTQASGGERLVVLSDDGWQQLFARAADAIGKRVRVNGVPCTVVGVMPRAFDWPEGTRLWQLSKEAVPPSPLDLKDPLTNRDAHYFEAVARLEPGVSLQAAQQDLHALATTLGREYPSTDGGADIDLVPIRVDITGDVRGALLLIQGAVALVLFIACANVSSLLIVRATTRRRELAIRAALGAGRADLIRQLLVESLVLGVVGGAVGLLLAAQLVDWLVRVLPAGLPRADTIGLDRTVALVTLAASLLTGILFGVLPAWHASRSDAAVAMKETGERGSSSHARGRSALVVAEIALTLVLLIGAGLLANSFLRLQRVDPGFRSAQVTIADLAVPQTRYPKGSDETRVYTRLVRDLTEHSEFQAAGIGFPAPFHGSNAAASFYIDGRDSSPHDQPHANLGIASGGFFAAMGIPLIAGRTFDDRDTADGAAPVAIVSAALARKHWPGDNPVGKRLRFENTASEPWFTVVGVTGDVHQLGLQEPAPALLYVPYSVFPLPFTTVVVRSTLPASTVASLLRTRLAAIDPDLPFADIKTLQSFVDRAIEEPRFRAMLIAAFAVLALVLASVGVFGLISYSVTQRTREIGIRVALGASPRRVLFSLVREGLVLALAGIAVGLAAAVVATRALSAFLFGVGRTDPTTFSAVALLLLAVALAASYVPSRRALRVDPVVALRTE
jgi:putative ABC transport system permease protein